MLDHFDTDEYDHGAACSVGRTSIHLKVLFSQNNSVILLKYKSFLQTLTD